MYDFCSRFELPSANASKLLPTAFQSLNDPCLPDLFTKKYPAMPGVIGLGSLFSLFAIEMWMHAKMPHGHSHGSATGEEFSGAARRTLPPPSASRGPPSVGGPPPQVDSLPVYIEEKRMMDEWVHDDKNQ
jgi:hypothetical protein